MTGTLQLHRGLTRAAPAPIGDAVHTTPVDPVAPLVQLLHQLVEMLSAAGDSAYVLKPLNGTSGTLGGHVRHCLDHIKSFLDGAEAGVLDYDRRERGTAVEIRRAAALDVILELEDRLARLDRALLHRTVRVSAMLDAEGTCMTVRSSLARELAFVISHTIHHAALMAGMCAQMGVAVPEGFGYAPSTLVHLSTSACARSR